MSLAPFLSVLMISGSVAFVLALLFVQQREDNGSVAFALVMIGSAIWSWGYALQISARSPELALIALRIKYIGILIVPTCWLWFALTYTDSIASLTRKQAAALAFFPVLTFVANITNDWHHLFYRRVNLAPPGALPIVTFDYAPWYWINIVYSYSLVLIGLWLLIRFWGRALRLHRIQIAVLIGALLLMTAISLTFYINEQFVGIVDVTPVLLALNGVLFYLALFRSRHLDARPIAYTHLFEQSSDGVLVFDMRGKVVDCNPAARRMLGLTHPVGQSVQSVLQQYPELAASCTSGVVNQPIHIEHSAQVIDAHIASLRDRRGQQTGSVLVMRDVTNQWRMQQALAESESRLREERRLFIGGPTVVFRWEAHEHCPVSYVSPNVQEQFGYAPEAFTEGGLMYLSLIHPDDRQRIQNEIADYIRRSVSWYRQEYRFRRADGEYRWVHDYTTVVYNKQNKPIYFLGYILDVTEQKRAEAEQLEIERRLQQTQKLESLGLLAGGVAHDFNNLLMAIMGNLDLALLALPKTSTAFQHIRNAMLATRHAAGLTQQLLAYAGRGGDRRTGVDLTRIVAGMADMLRVSVGRQTRLELHLDPYLPVFQADPSQIQQVVLNLILNAAEALPAHGGIISVRTGMRFCDEALLAANRTNERLSPGEYLVLEVADTGCGMDEDTQRRMFDPFFTTKAMGTGLGMSAVLGIVRNHHGGIVVDSAPGCGATVTVLFPPSSPVRESEPVKPDVSAAPEPITVLVVDDEADVRDVTARLLTHLNFRVIAVATGAEAIQTLQANASEVACVLLDANLTDMSGLVVLKALRAIAPHIAVVVSSGYSPHEVLARFAEAAIEGFVQKPYQITELYAAIRRALQRSVMATAPEMLSDADATPEVQ